MAAVKTDEEELDPEEEDEDEDEDEFEDDDDADDEEEENERKEEELSNAIADEGEPPSMVREDDPPPFDRPRAGNPRQVTWDDVEEARADRLESDIPQYDKYWEVRAKFHSQQS